MAIHWTLGIAAWAVDAFVARLAANQQNLPLAWFAVVGMISGSVGFG
jgi:hypothetical protein